MTIFKAYDRYRKVGQKLHSKIMEACLDRKAIEDAARLLGILHGKELRLNSEEEGTAFLDFCLYDYRVDGKTAIERYLEQFDGKNQDEKEVLNAWIASYSSFFKVVDVLPEEKQIVLTDLFNQKENIRLLDYSFSESILPGMMMFIRLVPCQDCYITSGNAFVFFEGKEKLIQNKYKALFQKVKSTDESIKRFVAFFKINRTEGIEVMYQ